MDRNEAIAYITEQYLQKHDLADLVRAMQKCMGNPVMVLDRGFRCAAFASDGEVADEDWNQMTSTGYADEAYLKQTEALISSFDRAQIHDPQITITQKNGKAVRRLVKDIYHDGVFRGGVEMLEEKTEITDTHKEIIAFASELLFLELERSEQRFGEPGSRRELYISSLFAGSEDLNADQRLFPIGEKYVLGILKLPQEKKYTSRYLSRLSFFKSAYLVAQEDLLLVLYHGEDLEMKEVRVKVREIASYFRTPVVYSPPYEDIRFLHTYSSERENVRQYLNTAKTIGAVTFVSLLFEKELMKLSDNSVLLTQLTRPFDSLKHYDAMHETELLKTLDVYLNCFCDLNKASEALFIHRNTLTYRIKRILQITSLELEDNEEILSTLMLLRIYRNQMQLSRKL